MWLWKDKVSYFKEISCPFTAFIEIYFPQPCQWVDKRLNKCDLFYIPLTEKKSVLTKLCHSSQYSNIFTMKNNNWEPVLDWMCVDQWFDAELVWYALVISLISHLSSTGVSWLCSTALTGCRRTAWLRLPPRWRQSLWTAETTTTWWPRSPLMLSTSSSPSSFCTKAWKSWATLLNRQF